MLHLITRDSDRMAPFLVTLRDCLPLSRDLVLSFQMVAIESILETFLIYQRIQKMFNLYIERVCNLE